MKETRKAKKPNEIINFTILEENFSYTTFSDKGDFYTFIHKTGSDKIVDATSPVLMHFETKDKNEYLNFKKEFSNSLRKFSTEIKLKKDLIEKFVDTMKKELQVDNKWFNPAYVIIEKKEFKSRNTYQNKTGKNEVSDYKKCSEIKPVVLLETLERMGKIIVSNVTPNTSGEEFWNYKITDDPEGREFKTSVKTRNHLFSSQENLYSKINDIFNDVKQSSKGYGKGSVGLIQFLGNNGLFPNAIYGETEGNKRYQRSLDYILEKVYDEVDKGSLANDHDLSTKIGNVESLKIMNYSRMPFKNNSKIGVIKSHLKDKRRLSDKLINRLLNEDLLYGGSFLSNTLGKENAEIKFYMNQFFFKLTDKNDLETGAEKLAIIERMVDGEKTQKLDKRNTHPVKGNAFRLKAKTSNPLGTFIGEAVIDVCSAYELFDIAGLEANNFNYVSIQGCSNLANFLAINAGFSIETNEDYRPYGEAFAVKFKTEKEKISSAQIETYNNNFSTYDYYFVNTNNEKSNEIMKKMLCANKVLGKEIKILNKKDREAYIDYNSYDKTKSVFLDETSFDEFFRLNKILFEIDEETNKYKTFKLNEKEEYVKFNQDIKNNIYSQMMKNFGTTTLLFGLDNDEAGVKYRKVINNLSEELGTKVYDMYPDTLPKKDTLNIKEFKDDVNDVLKYYYNLKDQGKEEEAFDVVEKYVQKLVPNLKIQKKNKAIKKP